MNAPEKICASCGRRIEWRKAWARDWDRVRHCSAACRRRGVRRIDRELEQEIEQRLDDRSRGATLCPSEAARAVHLRRDGDGSPDGWRTLMEPARRAARRLVAAGRLEITQRGAVVDPSTAKGPIRLRRPGG